MSIGTDAKSFKSPTSKLLRFFRESRDRWKAKVKKLTEKWRKAHVQMRAAEKSREHWKQVAREEKQKRKKAECELAELKKKFPSPVAQLPAPEVSLPPARHQYGLNVIQACVRLVLNAASSLRCASASLEELASDLPFDGEVPTPACHRLWLLRLGLFELTRAKERADDWIWIVDHTIQIGTKKCLLIVGLRLSAWNPERGPLTLQDLQIILLEPVEKSNGDIVFRQLQRAEAETGVPREIISDGCSDLKSGIQQYAAQHPQTAALYDIKHKAATVLRAELEADPRWKAFSLAVGQSRVSAAQTPLACLLSPTLKMKARYMNLEKLVRWASDMLGLLAKPRNDLRFDAALLERKFGWLRDYAPAIAEWQTTLDVLEMVTEYIRQHGYHRGAATKLRNIILPVPSPSMAARVAESLFTFVEAQSALAREGEHLMGSSEVLESLIGTGKRLEGQQSKSGFTKMILGMAAAVVTPTEGFIRQALETVLTKHVITWTDKYLGPSVQSLRRLAFQPAPAAEGTNSV